MRISDWSSDVCSSDLFSTPLPTETPAARLPLQGPQSLLCLDDNAQKAIRLCGRQGGFPWPGQYRSPPNRVSSSSWTAITPGANSRQFKTWRHPPMAEASSIRIAIVGTAGRTNDASRVSLEARSEEHTSELQSLMRISYAVFCLKKK